MIEQPSLKHLDHPVPDESVLRRLHPLLQDWWVERFGEYVEHNNGLFTAPQKDAIPLIDERKNTLVTSPTGAGKTLSCYSAIINDLLIDDLADELSNNVHCLYISPLKALANDIKRNLEVPLQALKEKADEHGESVNIRHAIRHGDTDSSERQKMLDETPHILNTTPESLAIILNAPKFREKLRSVRYVIVDEIHSLADNKRGTHLSVSLERLQELAGDYTRIGCSATIEPLDRVANFLCGRDDEGNERPCEIVDKRFVRDFDIEVESPVPDMIETGQEAARAALYERLQELVEANNMSLVFTNTRSGAERTLHNLRHNGPFDETNSAAHHSSLSKEKRQTVEEGLKNGDYDVVTTSTSLELGIDMQGLDMVVQVGSPKSIAAMLQRIGRAGHKLGKTVKGRVLVLDRNDLVECSVMADRALNGYIDRVFIPERAQDVAAQHVYGIAINKVRPYDEVRGILRRAWPYWDYSNDEFERLVAYLTARYDGMEEKNMYAKIWHDTNDEPDGEYHYDEYEPGIELIGKRGRRAQVIYMTNIGTIPDSFSCDVYTRDNKEWAGQLDENYLNTLEKGDVFVLGGDRFEFRYRRGTKVYVDRTGAPPNVPSWYSERLPLSYDLGREILSFQQDRALESSFDDMPINDHARSSLRGLYDQQTAYLGPESISTPSRTVMEVHTPPEQERYVYIRTVYGRRFNDGLSRLLAYRCAQRANVNVQVAVADQGFTLILPATAEVNVAKTMQAIERSEVRPDLRSSLRETDLLQRYFRINATRSLMILRNYKGSTKSAGQQQVKSDMMLGWAHEQESFPILEETYREILEDKLAVSEIEDYFEAVQNGDIDVCSYDVESPSPRSFSLAALSAGDVVLAEDRSLALKNYHEQVMDAIND